VDHPRIDFHPRVKRSLVHRLIAREADDGTSALVWFIAGAAASARCGPEPVTTDGPLGLARALMQLTNRPLALMPDTLLHHWLHDAFDADLQLE
jgi:hypothetical protein